MRVYENEPMVNIRPRFDFESPLPVQGIVLDEAKEKEKAALWHMVIHNTLAINVALVGFFLITWWIHGGFAVATAYVAQKIPAIWILAKYGIFSS